ncbi:MAG: hypothetical protein FJ213_12695 [Ignavibacteria bacterium]|nr:hypothetical protein [Ignavibacteria bacterium]
MHLVLDVALRLTAVTPELSSYMAHRSEFDKAALQRIAQRSCSRIGIDDPAAGNESFVAASATSFLSSQNQCVERLNIVRHALAIERL